MGLQLHPSSACCNRLSHYSAASQNSAIDSLPQNTPSKMADNKDYNTYLKEAPKDIFKRFPLKMVHGVPLMEPIVDIWEEIEQFQALPDDLLISTYPKAGTTWMQEIVDLILNGGDIENARRAPTHVRFPFLEIASPPPIPCGIDILKVTPAPRMIKTHLQLKLVPKSFWENNCKVIYVARNPKDNAVSYFYFDQLNKTQPEPGPWEQYIQKFMQGNVGWGSWYQHVCGYWDERKKHRMLYLFYEDMKEDPAREIKKVMEFLEVDLPPDVLQKIIQHTSFKAMKDNPMANYTSFPDTIIDKSCGEFMRKGEVGDWKNHFTVAQNEAFDEDYRNKMAGTTLTFRMEI